MVGARLDFFMNEWRYGFYVGTGDFMCLISFLSIEKLVQKIINKATTYYHGAS